MTAPAPPAPPTTFSAEDVDKLINSVPALETLINDQLATMGDAPTTVDLLKVQQAMQKWAMASEAGSKTLQTLKEEIGKVLQNM